MEDGPRSQLDVDAFGLENLFKILPRFLYGNGLSYEIEPLTVNSYREDTKIKL